MTQADLNCLQAKGRGMEPSPQPSEVANLLRPWPYTPLLWSRVVKKTNVSCVGHLVYGPVLGQATFEV